MSTRRGLLLFFLLAVLFLVGNRGSYRGYFQDDDLDNLSWVPNLPPQGYAEGFVSPWFSPHNFRPVGHFYFHALERTAGLDFRKWLAVLNAIHLLNVWLVWQLARSLRLAVWPAAAATLFFAYHFAAFDAYWKPMYVFDVTCGTFSLLCLLAYVHRRWVLSFLCLWAAYKSKELAVMLPVALAAYEFFLGDRNWKRLVPFFAFSAWFGLQAVLTNRRTNNAYTLRLTGPLLWQTIRFYAGKLLGVPLAGLLLLLLPVWVRDRRLWLGVVFFWATLLPLLVLPTRLYSVYLYLPLVGASIVVGALLREARPVVIVALFALWLPVTYFSRMRPYRAHEMQVAIENRAYTETLRPYVLANPNTAAFVFEGKPEFMQPWGVKGIVFYSTPREDITVAPVQAENATALLQEPGAALLRWDARRKTLRIEKPAFPAGAPSYLAVGQESILTAADGWYGSEGGFRWSAPVAKVKLTRAPGALLHLEYAVLAAHLAQPSRTLRVLVGGRPISSPTLEREGRQAAQWALPPDLSGVLEVELRVEPPLVVAGDPRPLGIPVSGLGFKPSP